MGIIVNKTDYSDKSPLLLSAVVMFWFIALPVFGWKWLRIGSKENARYDTMSTEAQILLKCFQNGRESPMKGRLKATSEEDQVGPVAHLTSLSFSHYNPLNFESHSPKHRKPTFLQFVNLQFTNIFSCFLVSAGCTCVPSDARTQKKRKNKAWDSIAACLFAIWQFYLALVFQIRDKITE